MMWHYFNKKIEKILTCHHTNYLYFNKKNKIIGGNYTKKNLLIIWVGNTFYLLFFIGR